MVARVVVTGVAALAMAGAGMVDLAWAQRGHGGGSPSIGGGGGGGGAAVGAGVGARGGGGGGPSVGAGPSVRSGSIGPGARSFSGPSRSFAGGNQFVGNNNWRGDWRHGRHFRGVFPFVGAYAYTYPYYDDDYYGSDRCAYVDPGSWWWRRYCAPYGY